MATLDDLLKRGYFPRELPPPFHSRSFAAAAPALSKAWPVKEWTRCVRHNLARPGGLRRPLAIPNPVSFHELAKTISTNWAAIKAHTWKHRLSASRPHPMKSSHRAVVPRYRYSDLPRLRALRRRAARYLLTTDISQFYPTIYTHSISWALHGKTVSKAALASKGKGAALLGNQIDKALQRMNDGQTHGIPIGPDTSLIVAELILAAADEILVSKCGSVLRGFRYVDDYELSFATLSDAETVLTEVQSVLADFELALNPRKTRVQELPRSLDGSWASDIARFKVRDAKQVRAQRNDLVSLFSKAFDAASNSPEDSVLRYAVARVQNVAIGKESWRTFQNCLMGALSADTSTGPAVFGTLYRVSATGGHAISKGPFAEVCDNIIRRHSAKGQGSEVAWALWAAAAWDLSLSSESAKAVSAMDDDVVALLALHIESKGRWPAGALDKTIWSAIVAQPRVLYSEHWLLGYEANQHKWLVTPSVAGNAAFSGMAAAGVSFFDAAKCAPTYPDASLPLPGGQLPDYYA